MPAKRRIVILGGGVGALTAAYYLTARPNWQQDYDITVYQLGWRLGGKGASSRNPDLGNRIEEHGLHIWFGFYENAFALMRKVHAPASVYDAFRPLDKVSMLEPVAGGWELWPLDFPALGGEPGQGNPVDSAWEVLTNLVKFAARYSAEWLGRVPLQEQVRVTVPDWGLHLFPRGGRDYTQLHPLDPVIRVMEGIGTDLALHKADMHHAWIADALRAVRDGAAHRIAGNAVERASFRRIWLVVDLCLTIAIGVLRDRLLSRGLAEIDGEELLEWLARHGASDEARKSTPVRALYDCCFAFVDGDTDKPNFAAGVALGCALRIGLMYRGHMCYEMRMGMGEAVVAPLYRVLRDRGVKFEFFHRVKRLELDGDRVARIHMARQVQLKNGSYDPLVFAPDGLPCWPDRPRYEQIVEGDALRERKINLESHWTPWQDTDLPPLELKPEDVVVLGISLGALGPICDELRANADWRNLLDKLPSIQTQSAQLWMERDLNGLGGPTERPAMVAAPEPFNVWADMSHQLPRESWPTGNAPASVQYFCGPMKGSFLERPQTDHAVPGDAWRSARDQVKQWLETYTGWPWPNAVAAGTKALDWELLHVLDNVSGAARLDRQWIRANIDPSERYVLSPKKLNLLRLRSSRSGFHNLYLAGDWTRTAINAGCVEAAVMSGMEASRAICGYPEKIAGENFMQG
jgi:uncharacterized protein with NAD-binding domain and iron-sulfur cluster